MKKRWDIVAIGLVGLLGGWGSAAGACEYELKSTHLLQCRPIALLDGPSGQPAWTYVEDKASNNKVLAHILCTCDAALKMPDAACDAHQTHKLTFTEPTTDILKTCGTQTALCQEPCQTLINHKDN
jgi:hypothetical protein